MKFESDTEKEAVITMNGGLACRSEVGGTKSGCTFGGFLMNTFIRGKHAVKT